MKDNTTEIVIKRFRDYFENITWTSKKGTMSIEDFLVAEIEAARKETIEEIYNAGVIGDVYDPRKSIMYLGYLMKLTQPEQGVEEDSTQ